MAGYIFYSSSLLQIAERAADKADDDPDQCRIAIVFAAVGLEAFVNECIDYLQEPKLNDDRALDLMRAVAAAGDLTARNATLANKIQLLSAGLVGRVFDRGKQPYQDFELLIAIRNALLHQRMERMPGEDVPDVQPSKLVERVRARGLVNIPAGAQLSILGIASTPTVARWAVLASIAMVEAVSELFPLGARYLLSYKPPKAIRAPSAPSV